MPCYSLYLTNQAVAVSASNQIRYVYVYKGVQASLNNHISTTWRIDFDGMFKNENYKYRKCRVRIRTVSSAVGNVSAFHTQTASLTCSLASQYNAPVTYDTTLLGLSNSANTPVSPSLFDVQMSTMETSQGVNVNIPTGYQFFTITYANDVNFTELNPAPGQFLVDFLLNFELYDPIK